MSSRESTGESGLEYEETALTLGLPGGTTTQQAVAERKRGFAETVDLTLAGEKIDPNGSKTANSLAAVGGGGVEGKGTAGADGSSDEVNDRESCRAGKPPAAKAQVVGWPPVRSYRKNALKSCTFVKVAVDGAPYLRKVDLETYCSYDQLLKALEEMFSCFTIRDYRLVDPVNGTEYMPTYEDKDGDWMLVGDVPWKMFVASCKRLRLMKSSEAVNLAPRSAGSKTQ